MSEPDATAGRQKSAAWAPYDYTDGRKQGNWKTEYPMEARKCIRLETAYLVLLLLGCLAGVLYIVRQSSDLPTPGSLTAAPLQDHDHGSMIFLGFVGALLAGMLGGCSFGIKCMYHFVAKLMWHEDRRLWRLLAPPLSGVLSLFMVFLVASGLLQIFDMNFVERPIRVMAFSFLVGYFSDKSLAKMADVADTLFGSGKKGSAGPKGDGQQ